MPDMWERARVRHESTPVPEELEFAVASALRAGQRRLRGRRALRRSVSGVLAGCACFVLLVNASPAFARAVSDVPVLGGLARLRSNAPFNPVSRNASPAISPVTLEKSKVSSCVQ